MKRDPRNEYEANNEMNCFYTNPTKFTPRVHQSRADYGSSVTRYGKSAKNRPWLNFLLAVVIGAALGVLLAWRG